MSGFNRFTLNDQTIVHILEVVRVTLKLAMPAHIIELERDETHAPVGFEHLDFFEEVKASDIRDCDRLHSSFIVLHECIMTGCEKIGRVKYEKFSYIRYKLDR